MPSKFNLGYNPMIPIYYLLGPNKLAANETSPGQSCSNEKAQKEQDKYGLLLQEPQEMNPHYIQQTQLLKSSYH